jgi:hypothetical protein
MATLLLLAFESAPSIKDARKPPVQSHGLCGPLEMGEKRHEVNRLQGAAVPADSPILCFPPRPSPPAACGAGEPVRLAPRHQSSAHERARRSGWMSSAAGALLIIGGCLRILPFFGLWILPLGLILL